MNQQQTQDEKPARRRRHGGPSFAVPPMPEPQGGRDLPAPPVLAFSQ